MIIYKDRGRDEGVGNEIRFTDYPILQNDFIDHHITDQLFLHLNQHRLDM